MRAYSIESFGSVDGAVLGSRDDPRPGTREILVRVRATSLNYSDLMVLKGGGRGPTKLGVVPLSDGAGEVGAIGHDVTRFAVGERGHRLLPSALVRRTDQAGLPDRPARRQPGRHAGGICGRQRGSRRRYAEPPLVRGSVDLAVRRGDRLGGVERYNAPARDMRAPKF
jgi:NADPH:quinone reductase-like Zn-dependent oxidoreductase